MVYEKVKELYNAIVTPELGKMTDATKAALLTRYWYIERFLELNVPLNSGVSVTAHNILCKVGDSNPNLLNTVLEIISNNLREFELTYKRGSAKIDGRYAYANKKFDASRDCALSGLIGHSFDGRFVEPLYKLFTPEKLDKSIETVKSITKDGLTVGQLLTLCGQDWYDLENINTDLNECIVIPVDDSDSGVMLVTPQVDAFMIMDLSTYKTLWENNLLSSLVMRGEVISSDEVKVECMKVGEALWTLKIV